VEVLGGHGKGVRGGVGVGVCFLDGVVGEVGVGGEGGEGCVGLGGEAEVERVVYPDF
jgi:hypothetical protein